MIAQTVVERAPKKPHPAKTTGDNDKRKRREQKLDEALEGTFPASDPVSLTNPALVRSDDAQDKKERDRG